MQGGHDHSDGEHPADRPPKKVKRRREPDAPLDPEEALRLKAEAARIAAEVFASTGAASAAHEGDEAPVKVRPCDMSASGYIVCPGTEPTGSRLLRWRLWPCVLMRTSLPVQISQLMQPLARRQPPKSASFSFHLLC